MTSCLRRQETNNCPER